MGCVKESKKKKTARDCLCAALHSCGHIVTKVNNPRQRKRRVAHIKTNFTQRQHRLSSIETHAQPFAPVAPESSTLVDKTNEEIKNSYSAAHLCFWTCRCSFVRWNDGQRGERGGTALLSVVCRAHAFWTFVQPASTPQNYLYFFFYGVQPYHSALRRAKVSQHWLEPLAFDNSKRRGKKKRKKKTWKSTKQNNTLWLGMLNNNKKKKRRVTRAMKETKEKKKKMASV